ncbi:MAG: DUF1788 domain-containing protein [Altibacter sp.]|uniref:DUF1788 domain-containing protein n=1 Tax=Altibacter sp. TaxID=2024823 RepID=UPI001D2275A2|nr:DUF1788 domain-containing protein [Altibacter sp.]MBZ0328279.1 DUF1788 domain-containing protein [Altibacter sp.]
MVELVNKFEKLYDKLSSRWFLQKDGLGGEIPFFISPYDAMDEINVMDSIQMLKKKLNNAGVPILEINLYDVVCEILDEKGGMERMFRVEKAKSKDKFLKALQSSLNIHQILIPNIDEKIKASNAKIYFLTGVGLVYPFIRSHTILNNLQNIAKEAPTVMFFPGEYDGHSLNLFGLLKDDNYYRAFNIDNIEAK